MSRARSASVVELLLQERRAKLLLEAPHPHRLREHLAWVGYRYWVELTERGRRALLQDHIEDGRE